MFLTLLWTALLILDIIAYVLKVTPTWGMVFGPLITLVFHYWIDYFVRKEK